MSLGFSVILLRIVNDFHRAFDDLLGMFDDFDCTHLCCNKIGKRTHFVCMTLRVASERPSDSPMSTAAKSAAHIGSVANSTDASDDSFGWELPGLRRAAEAQCARFLDLGFRPFRPDDAWQDRTRHRIAEALA